MDSGQCRHTGSGHAHRSVSGSSDRSLDRTRPFPRTHRPCVNTGSRTHRCSACDWGYSKRQDIERGSRGSLDNTTYATYHTSVKRTIDLLICSHVQPIDCERLLNVF
jgi:hypothetical protein